MSVHYDYRDMMSVSTCAGIGLKFHTTEGSHVVTVTVDTPCTTCTCTIHTPGLYNDGTFPNSKQCFNGDHRSSTYM